MSALSVPVRGLGVVVGGCYGCVTLLDLCCHLVATMRNVKRFLLIKPETLPQIVQETDNDDGRGQQNQAVQDTAWVNWQQSVVHVFHVRKGQKEEHINTQVGKGKILCAAFRVAESLHWIKTLR